ncbi:hypothetical protein B296_00011325 [Ensete ventricosum]|uniref:Glucose-6-phosphate dehydrogenase C-terminal domain-containing protein n=1 Tax=Ensete ventricosum TaxID=4639 RepID=A0A427A127_ENSVE|nr:hypothetical protein B296_00011325 [Ensete ventricosum]
MFLLIFPRENCSEKMEQFLKRCFYHSGQYESEENFADLDKKLKEHEVINICIYELYFDNYGIIRDIMQNHLLQILALFAMETPVSLDAEDIRNEKVKVLRSMKPLQLENVVIVQFRHVPGNLYKRSFGTDLDRATNELVIRVQPDEAIYLKINNKVPGLGMRLDRSNLNLLYSSRYSKEIPDAYERLLLDAIEGERRLFIRSDELDAAWELFTPLLKELEDKKIAPELYPHGSCGPAGAHYLAANYNVRWGDTVSDA